MLKTNEFEYKSLLKLDLQMFADDPEPTPDPEPQPEPEDKLELTAEELQKKIEAESDRKLAKAQKKWEATLEERIKEAQKETERLAKLSEKERKEEEISKREKDLENRLLDLQRKELKADAIAVLSEKSLPANFADFLLAEDAEKTLANINEFKTVFDNAVNEAVKGKLRQETPKAGGPSLANKNVSLKDLAAESRIIKN
jgi:DNA repair exonuclease SbcCD ATPase subunit